MGASNLKQKSLCNGLDVHMYVLKIRSIGPNMGLHGVRLHALRSIWDISLIILA